MQRLVATCFVWPGLAADAVAWCKECAACNRVKVTRQPTTTVEKMAIPAARFSHVHVDIVGPLPPSREGYKHLLTMINRSTRWPEAVLLRDTTSEAFLDAFVATWVAHFGVPSILTTDRGVQFTSATWAGWCGDYGVQHITTTAFHPQALGWWRGCTARGRTPFVPGVALPPGQIIYPQVWSEFKEEEIKIQRNKILFNTLLKKHLLGLLDENFKCSRLLCPHCHLNLD